MDYRAFTNDSLTMMYESVRGALASDDAQKAAGAALSAKRGETPLSKLKGASRSMADSLSEKQLEEFAQTKRKPLPAHKSRSK